MHNIISSGSKGNCIIYNKNIMVDIGVSYKAIKDFEKDIQLVLLTHIHDDHLTHSTLKKLQYERPTIRIGTGSHMLKYLEGLDNIDVFEVGKWYDYGPFKLSPVQLFHDVPNFGYRIDIKGYKIFHATDTSHLNGIDAKGYDLYAIEHNYDEEIILKNIQEKKQKGQYAYEEGALETHLSAQQAGDFIFNNKKEDSEILKLHISERNS